MEPFGESLNALRVSTTRTVICPWCGAGPAGLAATEGVFGERPGRQVKGRRGGR